MKRQVLEIGRVVLEWSKWFSWDQVKADARRRGAASVPAASGVYEARLKQSPNRLTIGRGSNLRFRVKQSLLKAKTAVGEQIRLNEDTSRIVIRWAVTDRPAAAEEELHKGHIRRFGALPKYTRHT